MSHYFQHIPFGESLPIQNPHAVSVSMPFLQNVIDYEEEKVEAITKMKSGYPRFFQNKLVEKLVFFIRNKHAISSDKVVLPIASFSAKIILENLVQTQFEFIEEDENVFLILENNPVFVKKCKDYIRNIGLLISSRKAESTLHKLDQITAIFQEEKTVNAPEYLIKNVLSKAYSNVSESNVLLTNSGMNALFATYKTILEIRKKENRTVTIQLGWLYVDTMEIIEKQSEEYHLQINIYNKKQLENWLESNHLKVATLITEVTTNPLIQCLDLPWLSKLCKKYNIVLIVDSTIATPFNVAVLPYCDIAVESLTKFACGNADLLYGAIILNEDSAIVRANREEFLNQIVLPFQGETERLAHQITEYENRVEKISKNTKILYDYLIKQDFVKEIYSVYHKDSIDNFTKIQKNKTAFPGLLSIVFNEDFQKYYDNLHLAKGPSLGAEFTIAMPYVYLAHYNHLKIQSGIEELERLGINPNLLRISVGTESVSELISAFETMKEKVAKTYNSILEL